MCNMCSGTFSMKELTSYLVLLVTGDDVFGGFLCVVVIDS